MVRGATRSGPSASASGRTGERLLQPPSLLQPEGPAGAPRQSPLVGASAPHRPPTDSSGRALGGREGASDQRYPGGRRNVRVASGRANAVASRRDSLQRFPTSCTPIGSPLRSSL